MDTDAAPGSLVGAQGEEDPGDGWVRGGGGGPVEDQGGPGSWARVTETHSAEVGIGPEVPAPS